MCVCVCVCAHACACGLSSHVVHLLGNLPLTCLDVLLAPKVQQGSIEHMGINMDVVNMLLEFMEKRLDRVSFLPAQPPA